MKKWQIIDKHDIIVFEGDTRECAQWLEVSVKRFTNAAWYAKKWGTLHQGYTIKEIVKDV